MILEFIQNVAEHEKQSKCQSKYSYNLYHEFNKIVRIYFICEEYYFFVHAII